MKTRIAKYHESVKLDNVALKQGAIYADEITDIGRYWSGDLGDNKRLSNKIKGLSARVVIETESQLAIPIFFRWAIVQPRYRNDLADAGPGKFFVDNFFDDPRSGSTAWMGHTNADGFATNGQGASFCQLPIDKERYRVYSDKITVVGPGIASTTDTSFGAFTGAEGMPPVIVRDDVIKLNTTLHYDKISGSADDTSQKCLNPIYLIYMCRQTLAGAQATAPTANVMSMSARVSIKWIDQF